MDSYNAYVAVANSEEGYMSWTDEQLLTFQKEFCDIDLQRLEVLALAEALCYRPKGRGFDSRGGHWISNLPNPSICTMALGCKGWPACKADNLTTIFEPMIWKIWGLRCLTDPYASAACYSDISLINGILKLQICLYSRICKRLWLGHHLAPWYHIR
jgi:hypothetical protein